jgi:hypothetical protein
MIARAFAMYVGAPKRPYPVRPQLKQRPASRPVRPAK